MEKRKPGCRFYVDDIPSMHTIAKLDTRYNVLKMQGDEPSSIINSSEETRPI